MILSDKNPYRIVMSHDYQIDDEVDESELQATQIFVNNGYRMPSYINKYSKNRIIINDQLQSFVSKLTDGLVQNIPYNHELAKAVLFLARRNPSLQNIVPPVNKLLFPVESSSLQFENNLNDIYSCSTTLEYLANKQVDQLLDSENYEFTLLTMDDLYCDLEKSEIVKLSERRSLKYRFQKTRLGYLPLKLLLSGFIEDYILTDKAGDKVYLSQFLFRSIIRPRELQYICTYIQSGNLEITLQILQQNRNTFYNYVKDINKLIGSNNIWELYDLLESFGLTED